MSTATCCAPVVLATRRPWFDRLHHAVRAAASDAGSRSLRAWRAARQARLEQQAIERLHDDGLSAEALQDIGFAAWQVERAQQLRSREIERWLW